MEEESGGGEVGREGCEPCLSLLSRLEEEGSSNQKLLQDRTSADSKIKGLEEQITVHEDNISKVCVCVCVYVSVCECV